MAEELKTGTDEQSINVNEAKVTLTQADLDNLINSKFAKGAEKATKTLLESLGVESVDTIKSMMDKQKELEEANKSELQKALDVMKAKEDELLNTKKELDAFKIKTAVSNIAIQYGITDLDYLEYQYNRQSSSEGFSVDSFINGLKENKSSLFNDVQKPTVKTDTSNKQGDPRSFEERVKQCRTPKELDALYKEIV
jgi:hypothetical protein